MWSLVAGWGAVTANFLGPVVNADGQRQNISRVLAFKMGGDSGIATETGAIAAGATPPEPFGSEAQVAEGGGLYMRYCSVCHGVGV